MKSPSSRDRESGPPRSWRSRWRALERGAVQPRLDGELDRLVTHLNQRCVGSTAPLRGATRISVTGDPSLISNAFHVAGTSTDHLTVIDVKVDRVGLPEVEAVAREVDAPIVSIGWATHPIERARVVAIVGPPTWAEPIPAPASFSVCAVMFAYNEADIIRPSIEHLVEQGIEVYLIDNCSTDGTADCVADLVGNGVIAVERFPSGGGSDGFDLTGLLQRGEQVTSEMSHDWCVLHDVDEVRDAPWPGVTYRDGFYNADRLGFNAVDHTIFQFRPTDDDFRPGESFQRHLRYFELVSGSRIAVNVKAWRNVGRVDISSSGGHEARFDRRSVFPLNCALRHYPVRSQRHGEAKVFRDRQPRYVESELAKGWHYHYARMRKGHDFLHDPKDLEFYDPANFDAEFLLPRIARLGIPIRDPGLTEWLRHIGVSGLRRAGLLQKASSVKARLRS